MIRQREEVRLRIRHGHGHGRGGDGDVGIGQRHGGAVAVRMLMAAARTRRLLGQRIETKGEERGMGHGRGGGGWRRGRGRAPTVGELSRRRIAGHGVEADGVQMRRPTLTLHRHRHGDVGDFFESGGHIQSQTEFVVCGRFMVYLLLVLG